MMSWLRKIFLNRNRETTDENRRLPDGAICNAVRIPDGDPPEWIRVAPIGTFLDHWSGPYELTAEHVRQMADNFERSSIDVLVDVDHASFFAGDSKAAGWITGVEVRDDGLYARYPEWTPFGEGLIANREYRYFSPTFFLAETDRQNRPIGAVLHSIALTNTPYFRNAEISPVGNADRKITEANPPTLMDREKLIAQLGLKAEATDQEIEQAIGQLKEKAAPAPVADPPVEEPAADLGGDSSAVKIEQLEATVNSLAKKLGDRDEADQATRAEALVNQAVAHFKILPRDQGAYLRSAKADFAATKAELDGIAAGSQKPGKVTVRPKEGDQAVPCETGFARARDPKLMEYVNKAQAR